MNAAASYATPDSFYVVFMVFLSLCGFLWIVTGTTEDDAAMLPTSDRPGKAWRSGLAISGDSLSAVTLMALVGLITLTGFDGVMISLACAMSLVLLMLLAEPLRRAGGHTVADALARRFPERSVRVALGLLTLMICLPYLVLQLTAIGALTTFVLGLTSSAAQAGCIIATGLLMIFLAVSGGLRGTARVQVVKVVALLLVLSVVALLVLHRFGWNPDRLLGAAAARSSHGDAFLGPGVQYGSGAYAMANRFGQFITLALAVGCLPQVTMRILSAPGGRATRSAMHWAIAQFLLVSALLAVIGVGAAAVLGGPELLTADSTGNSALLLVADALRPGGVLMPAVFCAVFLTALATVADVSIAAAISVARDLLPRSAPRSSAPDPRQERLARWTATLIGALTIALAVLSANWNLLVLSTLAMTLTASALAPVLAYGLLWPRFTGRGVLWCVYGSSLLTIVLVIVSPLISGSPTAALPDHDFRWTALVNPGVLTVPFGFLLGWLGSLPGARGETADGTGRPRMRSGNGRRFMGS